MVSGLLHPLHITYSSAEEQAQTSSLVLGVLIHRLFLTLDYQRDEETCDRKFYKSVAAAQVKTDQVLTDISS
jgi:hypothetical protein